MESIKKYNIYGVNRKYESDYGRNIDHNTISPEQALKDLREDAKRHSFEQRQHLNKRLDIIENALKRLEQLQIIIGAEKIEDLPKVALETENACYSNSYNLKKAEKKLKALEIIKEKGIDVDALKYHKDLEHYNFSLRGRYESLTQEEFDLLKEVLL